MNKCFDCIRLGAIALDPAAAPLGGGNFGGTVLVKAEDDTGFARE